MKSCGVAALKPDALLLLLCLLVSTVVDLDHPPHRLLSISRLSRMNSLADVELQLCMHGLSRKEILTFARCSARLMHAASDPFAWQRAGLLALSSESLPAISAVTHPFPYWLLRSMPVALRCNYSTVQPNSKPDPDGTMRRILSSSSALLIHSLDATRFDRIPRERWEALLVAPRMQQLRVLMAWCNDPDGRLLRLLSGLPRLHTLRLTFAVAASNPDAWASIVDAPALTSLSVGHPGLLALAQMARCSQLRQLALSSFKLTSSASRAALAGFSQIEHLSLEHGAVSPDSVDDGQCHRAMFSSLVRLHTLRLVQIPKLDLVLPSIAAAPCLTALHVEPYYRQLPSASVIRSLLVAVPRLRVTVDSCRNAGWRNADAFVRLNIELKGCEERFAIV